MATKDDEIKSLKAENERLKAVLGDQLEGKHGATHRWVVNVVKYADKLNELLDKLAQYAFECPCCLGEGEHNHEANCELVEFWRVTDHPAYRPAIDTTFERWCRNQEYFEKEERRRERQCTAQGKTRCRLEGGHEGAHEFPRSVSMESWNEQLKALYPNTRIDNLAYEGNALLGMIAAVDDPAGPGPVDPASRIITDPNELRIIENPFVSPSTAYLLSNPTQYGPSLLDKDGPVEVMRRAKEALDKIAKGEK